MQLRLRKERLSRQWTQEDVAIKLNVSKQAVSDWETGSRFPRQQTLNKLENLYQLPQRELFKNIE